ncbi:uncharacterized protein DS421_8g228570 [Arachis hypogaea]|nr:uncharacterized protein DS421_8g228570 [Arachis hypogaea]
MPLHDRIVLYLEKADLYHLARLNARWFWLDEPLVSAFVERWRPETQTFHMPFRECTITLQDVAYQLGLPVDGLPVSGCLTNFEKFMEEGKLVWEWVLSDDAMEETVRIYARAYIMMLLSTQLFGDKSGNQAPCSYYSHGFSGGFLASSRGDSTHIPFHWHPGHLLAFIRPQGGESRLVSPSFGPIRRSKYILTEEHSRLWRTCTCLIYFAVIEWHQDGKGGDRWFPNYYQVWHLSWQNRVDAILSIPRVPDHGPSTDFLRWWYRVALIFLSPDSLIADPRAEEISQDVAQRGSSQAPSRDDRSGGDGVGHANHRVWRGCSQCRGGSSGGTSVGPGDRPAEHAGAETQEVPLTHVSSSQIYHDIHGQMFDDLAGPTFTMDTDHEVRSLQFYSDFADLIQDDDPPYFQQQTPQD